MGNRAGVDWASEKHDVRVCNAAGDELLASTFAHNEAGLGSLCRVLVQMKVELVAVERPDGVLVDRLLDGCWRCIPTRWPPRVRGSVPQAGSLTTLTRS